VSVHHVCGHGSDGARLPKTRAQGSENKARVLTLFNRPMAYITTIEPSRITFIQLIHSSVSSQVFSVKYDGMKYCLKVVCIT
jgi:hypothetical protein